MKNWRKQECTGYMKGLVVMADMLLEFENKNGKFVGSLDRWKYFCWTASKVLASFPDTTAKKAFACFPKILQGKLFILFLLQNLTFKFHKILSVDRLGALRATALCFSLWRSTKSWLRISLLMMRNKRVSRLWELQALRRKMWLAVLGAVVVYNSGGQKASSDICFC